MSFELTPELRAYIAKAIQEGVIGGDGRSPLRERQLHDLNRQPSAKDPRPLFVWSADQPLDYKPGPYQEFPKLMWHLESGKEITVHDFAEQRMYSDIYTTEPPKTPAPVDVMTDIQTMFEGLTEDEQKMIVDAQKQDRIKALQAKLSALPEAALEALLAKAEPKKRGPGRPKKAE